MNAFSCNVRRLMSDKHISSCKLAKSVGVHISTVTNWRDGANPKIEHLKLVADYFGVTVDSLLAEHPQHTTEQVQ